MLLTSPDTFGRPTQAGGGRSRRLPHTFVLNPYFLVVRIDYAVVMAAVVRCTAVIGLALLRGGLLDTASRRWRRTLLHGIGRGLDGLDVIALVLRLQILESGLHGRLLGLGDLVAKLVQGLLRLVDD